MQFCCAKYIDCGDIAKNELNGKLSGIFGWSGERENYFPLTILRLIGSPFVTNMAKLNGNEPLRANTEDPRGERAIKRNFQSQESHDVSREIEQFRNGIEMERKTDYRIYLSVISIWGELTNSWHKKIML